jgi:hypothetical protein
LAQVTQPWGDLSQGFKATEITVIVGDLSQGHSYLTIFTDFFPLNLGWSEFFLKTNNTLLCCVAKLAKVKNKDTRDTL